MQLRLPGMTAALAMGVAGAVLSACALGAYFYSVHHLETLLDTARTTALRQGELIRAALEHQMLEKDRTLIASMIRSFGSQAPLSNVLVVDRHGRLRYASTPIRDQAELSLDSPTCQACHRLPPAQRESSRVIETADQTLLRTVIPLRNRPACHACHDPADRINGVLIVDVDAGEIRASMNRDIRWMALGSGALTLLLVAAIGLLVRVVVMRRLQRFETAARQIAAGDLERRVPAEGSDTLSWLAGEFNTMADSMTGLLSEVRDQRERLETVINSIDDGIVVLDARRSVVAANQAFLQRIARSHEEVRGACCHDLAACVCQAGECPTQACFHTGDRQVRILQRPGPGGRMLCEEVHASPIRNGGGGVALVVEVWRDITERRAAEARLADSHRLASLGLLASGFSHELNTPLATVLACVEGIQRETGDTAAASHHIEQNARIAREQLLRCRAVVQHFLRLARGQPSSGDLVDVGAAVGAVVRLIEPTASAHGVALVAEDLPSGVHVRVAEAELQQVVLNLLLNAVQACSRRGTVRLDVEVGDVVRIRVRDDGCGIAPENLTRIFEPFFNLRQGGTGLGLFLSLNSVRTWGGDIQVTSSPGQGSTFDILLPPEQRRTQQHRSTA